MNIDGLDSVADSTDWIPTPLSGLSAVEAALRCQICKDFYTTPMLTSCNHTFCSLCIRRALSAEGKCPLCRASEQEMRLRSNWSMEEVVAAFTRARAAVLDFARRPHAPVRADTPKRTADEMRNGDGDGDDDDYDGRQPSSQQQQRSSKRLRSSARLSKTRGMEATAEMARQESHIHDPEPEPEPAPEPEPNDGLVRCPICQRRMKEIQVDRHMDTTCPGAPDPAPPPRPKPTAVITNAFAPSTSSFSANTTITTATTATTTTITTAKPPPPTAKTKKPHHPPPPERRPALNYTLIREPQLRRELADAGLSTAGNRAMLERRHREWVMICNANCDAQRPKRTSDLRRDLDVWERTQGSRAPAPTTGAGAGAGSSSSRSGAGDGAHIRDKDFDGAAWAAKHDGSFRDLIADARRTRALAQAGAKPKDADSGGGSGGSGSGAGGEGKEENAVDGAPATVKPTAVESDSPIIPPAERMVIDLVDDDPPIAAAAIK
ncbi:putative E3 ubiquitin-protein ligase RAD18 [Rosellinia necatrix]|uniref:Postreplication repair E3 ubiquitin-protein ligase RAD18 n=1 Tax=Rosellinia necatrix TaxID=77044 RepID=A0A1W2TTK0_ROSNE|nr:putative E3 ubiquitin-protein ligase RAD18 [Rosellinia necatrix]